MKRNVCRSVLVGCAALGAIGIGLSAQAELKGPPEGRQQLVDALDAAWVRALDEGQVREIADEIIYQDVYLSPADAGRFFVGCVEAAPEESLPPPARRRHPPAAARRTSRPCRREEWGCEGCPRREKGL